MISQAFTAETLPATWLIGAVTCRLVLLGGAFSHDYPPSMPLMPCGPREQLLFIRLFWRYVIIFQEEVARKEYRGLRPPFDAYLDIETTGLSAVRNEITVIGIFVAGEGILRFTQLVGGKATKANLLRSLRQVGTIYTYNGNRFDIPFIDSRLDVDLTQYFRHHDLMYDCWSNNLYGGFKAVERQLGISRRLHDIGGLEAVALWWRYQIDRDEQALSLLLEYNREDVVNLMILRDKLESLSVRRPLS